MYSRGEVCSGGFDSCGVEGRQVSRTDKSCSVLVVNGNRDGCRNLPNGLESLLHVNRLSHHYHIHARMSGLARA